MGGDKIKLRKDLFVVGGDRQAQSQKGFALLGSNCATESGGGADNERSCAPFGFAGREEAQPLGLPDEEKEVAQAAAIDAPGMDARRAKTVSRAWCTRARSAKAEAPKQAPNAKEADRSPPLPTQ